MNIKQIIFFASLFLCLFRISLGQYKEKWNVEKMSSKNGVEKKKEVKRWMHI